MPASAAARPGSGDAAPLAVASYNVHGFVGTDGRLDVARCFRVIEGLDADLVALQEVHAPEASPGRACFRRLSEALGYRAILGETLRRAGAPYGNALLTRMAPAHVVRHALPSGPEPRGAIEAWFDRDGALVRVIATHLGLGMRERRRQVARLVEILGPGTRAFEEPAITILLGDLNVWAPGGRALRPVLDCLGCLESPASFPSRYPVLRLDRIGVRPAEACLDVHALRGPLVRRASDHLPVRARLACPSPPAD